MRLFHLDDEIVVEVTEKGTRENLLEGFEVGDQVSNPIYSVVDEHLAVVFLLILLPLLGHLFVRFLRWRASGGKTWAARLLTGYAEQPTARRVAIWAILTSAAVHMLLVFTHEVSEYTALYFMGSIALVLAARWVTFGADRKLSALVLVGSVVTFWFLGIPPDEVGVVTKLIEMFALALLVVPGDGRRYRYAPVGVVALVVFSGIATWIGAFSAVGADGGHHGGEYPDPGTVVPYLEVLEATEAEHRAADELYDQVVEALAKFEDPLVAEAHGYDVLPIVGTDHHADNAEYLEDGRIFDPERPETLVYAQGANGPVLLGAMFQMQGFREPGPRVGGPLTVWHGHENVCLSLIPPAMVSLQSPYGVCPIGSVNIPATNEMIHAWTIPGVDDGWGHLDEEFLAEYLNG